MKQNNSVDLDCILLESGSDPQLTVIWLHGLGADGSDFVPIVSALNLPSSLTVRFLFPHAPIIPVSINNNYPMRAWFDITSSEFSQKPDYEKIRKSCEQINRLIAKEIATGTKASRIILAGFSQGAVLALYAGLTYPQTLKGIIALSGALIITDNELQNTPKIPIFLAHGMHDTVVPFPLSQLANDQLTRFNFPLTYKTYAIGHSVSQEEIADIREWLLNIGQS